MLFLVLKIDGREGFAGSSSIWHSIKFGNWPQDLAVSFADDSMEGDTGTRRRRCVLSFKKTDEKDMPGSSYVWHCIGFRNWPSSFLSLTIRWKEIQGQDADAVFSTARFSEDHNGEELDTTCEMFQMGEHILCWCGGRFCWWDLSRINTVLFLFCILCSCVVFFFVFCNYSVCFLWKLFTSPN